MEMNHDASLIAVANGKTNIQNTYRAEPDYVLGHAD
jgi:hypothetical protein